MFQFEFGAVDPEHEIKVHFSYYVPFEDDKVLMLPISFSPTLMLNPGEGPPVDNVVAANAFNLTVVCPDFIESVTNLATGNDLEQGVGDSRDNNTCFILHNQESLNIKLKFNPVQNNDRTTDSIMCDLNTIVPEDRRELRDKKAIVIDHKIKCNYTKIDKCELHFAIDCSDNMRQSKQAIQRALLEVVNLLGAESSKIKISCFGQQNLKTWHNGMGDLENWLTSTMTENFGLHPEIAKYLGQIYSDTNAEANCPRQVILLTNAAPMNYDKIIELAQSARTSGCYHNRTFTIGIDRTVSQGLCKKIAKMAGGKALFCSTMDDIAVHLTSQVESAQLKSNLKLKSFKATLCSNATTEQVDPAAIRNCGLWNETDLDNITLFDGNGDMEIDTILTENVTHIRTGFIFNNNKAPEVDWSVKVDVVLEEIDSGNTISTSEELSIPFVARPNAVFYSYIQKALNRRINLRLTDAGLKQSTNALSKTMQVLCEQTCFCYVKRTNERPVNSRGGIIAEPVAQRPRREDVEEVTVDRGVLHDEVTNVDSGNQLQPARPSGHCGGPSSGSSTTRSKLTASIQDVNNMTNINGLLKKTPESSKALNKISGCRISILNDWKLLDEKTTEILRQGDDEKMIQDDWKQTLLSIAFYRLFRPSHESAEIKKWKQTIKRSKHLLETLALLDNKDIQRIVDHLKSHYNLQ